MRTTALLNMLLILAVPVPALAHDAPGDHPALSKLGRGLAGVTTGFLELPGNVVAVSRDQGLWGGLTIGFVKGVGMIPVRELVGVYDITTSPIPAPGNYAPVIEPEYPWSYFEGASEARMSLAMRGEDTRVASRTHSRTSSTTSGARK